MKILVAVAVVLVVSTQLLAAEIGANDDLHYWSDWSDSDQIKVSSGRQRTRVALPGLGSCHLPPATAPWLAWRALGARTEGAGTGRHPGSRRTVCAHQPSFSPRLQGRSRELTGKTMVSPPGDTDFGDSGPAVRTWGSETLRRGGVGGAGRRQKRGQGPSCWELRDGDGWEASVLP